MTIPDLTDPCWCGSGLTYETCHSRVDSLGPEMRLLGARAIYAEDWQVNAQNFEAQGGYKWMASQLNHYNPKRILDIGCGTGNGIVALLNQFPDSKIVSVDENPHIISVARKHLESVGVTTNIVGRLRHTMTSQRSHVLSYAPNQLRLRGGVDLIESDMLADSELERFLSKQSKFDAITVWLIGSHLLRYHECDDHRDNIRSPIAYRWEVQASAFLWATQFLRPGGVLHIVDRGPPPLTSETIAAVLEPLRGFASGTRGVVSIQSLDHFKYVEADAGKAIKMVDASGDQVDSDSLALISVMAIKS